MSKKTLLKQVLFGRIQRYVWLCLFLVAFSFLSTFFNSPQKVEAATSGTMNFQARLLQSSGALVPDGYYNVEFKLYNTSSGGSSLWTETYKQGNRVRVANGYLTVNLGALSGFSSSINWDQEHWLTMNIGGTANIADPDWDGEMTPRLKLTAVPYAFMAGKLRQTNGAHTSTLDFIAPTASRNIWVPDEDGTICLQGSANCGFVTGSASGFIQNSTSPQTADFNLTGNGTLGGNLTVGGNAALGSSSALTFGGDTNLYRSAANTLKTDDNLVVSGNLESNGTVLFKNTADSSDAFQVQNAAGDSLLKADTAQMKVTVGGDLQVGSVLGSKIFTDGFESGNTGRWTTSSSDVVSTERVRNGKYATKFVIDQGNGEYPGLSKEDIKNTNIAYYRSYINVDAQTTGNLSFMYLSASRQNFNSTYFTAYRNLSDGMLCVEYEYWDEGIDDYVLTSHCSTQFLPLDEWHRVELKVDVTNELAPTLELYYDGNQIIDENIDVDAVTSNEGINLAELGYGGSADATFYVDDVAFSTEPTGASASAIISDDLHVGGDASFGGSVSFNGGLNVQDYLNINSDEGNVSIQGGNIEATGRLSADKGISIGSVFEINNEHNFFTNGNLKGSLSLSTANEGGYVGFSDSFNSKSMALWDTKQSVTAYSSAANINISNSTSVARTGIGSISPDTRYANVRAYAVVDSHTSGDVPLLSLYNSNGDRFTLYRQFSDGKLCLYNGVAATSYCTTQDIPLDTYTYIELAVGLNSVWGRSSYYDNNQEEYVGGPWGSFSGSTGSYPITQVEIGTSNGSGIAAQYSIDDIIVTDYDNGAAASLTVGESFHVQGSSSFANKVLLKNSVDSTSAFQIQNAAGTSNLFIADTANSRISIGGIPANSLLTIGTNTTTAAGGITFGTDTNLYRSGVNALKTDDSLEVAGDFSVGGNTTLSGDFTNNGEALFSSDSTSALKVQNAAGTSVLLTADTTNNRVSVGNAGTATGQFYVGGRVPSSVLGSASITSGGGVYVQNNYAYVTKGSFGASALQIFDISNPASPTSVGSVATGDGSNGVHVQGQYAYVVNNVANTFQVINISNPASPTSVGSVATGSLPSGVYVQGKYAYVSNQGSNTLQIFDISNPASPTSVGSVATGNAPKIPYVQGNYAYVPNQTSNTLQIFDISNPASPTSVGSVATGTNPQSVQVQGRYAYVANNASNTLQIFDISNPASPTSVGSVATGLNNPRAVYVQGRYAYLAVASNLQIIDISNPTAPGVVGNVSAGSSGTFAVHVQGRYAYVIEGTGLKIFDVGGSYIQQLEVGGLAVSGLETSGNAAFSGNVSVQGGLTVGQVAQFSAGMGVLGNTSITATNENAFTVQNNSGGTLIKADTSNMRVGIGTDTPQEVLHVMGPDTANNGGKGRIAIGDYCHEDDVSCSGSGTNVFIGEYYVRGSSLLAEVDTDVLQLQGKSGIVLTTGYDADKINLEINTSGAARFQNTTDSATAFRIQRSIANGSGNVLTADTTNTRVLIGSATSPTLSGAQLVVTAAEVQTSLRVGNATNGFSFNDTATGESGKLRLYGSARNIKRITLNAEYAGAVLSPTGASDLCSGSDTGTGSMTAGFDSSALKNYYKWTSTQSNCQSFEIVAQVTLPSDWDGWATSVGNYSTNDIWASSTSNTSAYISFWDTTGALVVDDSTITPGSANSWQVTSGTLAGTYAAGGTFTVKVRLAAKSGASIQLGKLTFDYLSKF